MCMLFVYINDGTDKDIGYKLVLISNRDEYWARPTGCAKFQGENKNWIGGIDLEPGREGGTWLGMNKHGQFAVLLNILAKQELDKKGRGSLVTNFVNNTQITCEGYFDSLQRDMSNYNPFQLVLIDLRGNSPGFHILNNEDTEVDTCRMTLHQRTIGVDNSINSVHKPWCKTKYGEKRFRELLSQHGDLQSKEVLVEKLTDLLNDRTRLFPDAQLQEQFRHVGREDEGCIIEERSALNVFSPSVQYGTRTNTVILVDHEGNCDYVERTLETPVNVEKPCFTSVRYNFKIDISNPMSHP